MRDDRLPARASTPTTSSTSRRPIEDVDLFASDRALRDAVAANGAGAEAAALSEFGRRWGTAAMFEAARLANENTPKLKTFDTKGFRRDVVEFHPAYHGFMAESMRDGPACLDLGCARAARGGAVRGRARGALLHGGAGRERAHVPDHHDARLRRRARGRARAARKADRQDHRRARTTRASCRGGRRTASRSAWA